MTAEEYLKAYNGYFWHWEDRGTVIAIPEGRTIAYKEYLKEIIQYLSETGLPPFGSLVLALIATGTDVERSFEKVTHIWRANGMTIPESNEAMGFLEILSKVPEPYKSGSLRLRLFQTIFADCHNMVSIRQAKKISDTLNYKALNKRVFVEKADLTSSECYKSLRTIALLGRKFPTTEYIIQRVTDIPEVDEELLLEKNDGNEQLKPDFIEQLVEYQNTFHIGSLVKRIWSGLNIPVHSVMPSQQPLGGISDLTNKGDFDKLLISEFANDDLVFMSRLANNEALYIHREIPPNTNDLKRIILIDITLKNWGNPKIISFAAMLAIAKHPKTDIECFAYLVGTNYHPIGIDKVEQIAAAQQITDVALEPSQGIISFLKEQAELGNVEIFFITAASVVKQPSMQQLMSDYSGSINYWIYTDEEGNIDVYKRQQNSKKHLQHLKLPLQELWATTKRETIEGTKKKSTSLESEIPILFPKPTDVKEMLSTSDGQIFLISTNKMVFRWHDKPNKTSNKGWELVYEKLPFMSADFEIGLASSGDHYLLVYYNYSKKATIINLQTQKTIEVVFDHWKYSYVRRSFIFANDCFVHLNEKGAWAIDLSGNILNMGVFNRNMFEKRSEELNQLGQRFYQKSYLKNVKEVFINQGNGLVFNIHELSLFGQDEISLYKTKLYSHNIRAKRDEQHVFSFPDGSFIEISKTGVALLRSINLAIPSIYIPLVLETKLGVATQDHFAGNLYYYREKRYDVVLKKVGEKKLECIKLVKKYSGTGLAESKVLMESFPSRVATSYSKLDALEIKKEFEYIQVEVDVVDAQLPLTQTKELVEIPSNEFYSKYIEAFILNIVNHGVKN
ncbi:MAG: ribosomal protein L7/L12 [Chitinophagales bacterium]|nr:ribosomal protein L7/L12 [Chitinophagales bacterium]